MRVRKALYYGRSLWALTAVATLRSIVDTVLSGGRALELRDGTTLRLSARIDLLIVKETLVDDVYGLSELDADDGIVVDVGAGIGEFTIEAAKRLPGGSVLAFEPNPAVFRLLEENVRGCRLVNVRMESIAIGTQDEYLLDVSSAAATASPAREPSRGGVLVSAQRLDEVVPAGPVRLLKIDCEGLELDVLESADVLLSRVERVVVEYHRHLLSEADRRVQQHLRERGFEAQLRPDRYDRSLGYVDARRVADGPAQRGPGPGSRASASGGVSRT